MTSYRSFAGGPFGSNLKSCDYTENVIPVIQLNNITETYLDFSQRIIFTSTKKADELKACNAFPNELIIAKMMPAGRACISSTLYSRYVLGSDAIRVSPDLSLTNLFFIRAQINSNRIKAYIRERTTGSTRQRIGIPELKKIPMFMPTKIEQDKIGNFVELLELRIATQNKIIKERKTLIFLEYLMTIRRKLYGHQRDFQIMDGREEIICKGIYVFCILFASY